MGKDLKTSETDDMSLGVLRACVKGEGRGKAARDVSLSWGSWKGAGRGQAMGCSHQEGGLGLGAGLERGKSKLYWWPPHRRAPPGLRLGSN